MYVQEDMRAMFEAMTGKHVTIRLLDPPLHEFLPNVRTVAALHRTFLSLSLSCRHYHLSCAMPSLFHLDTTQQQNHEDTAALAKRINKPIEVVRHEIQELKEANPMLGFRGW